MNEEDDGFTDNWLTIQMGYELRRDVFDHKDGGLATFVNWADVELQVPNGMTARQIFSAIRAWHQGFLAGQKYGTSENQKKIRLLLGLESEVGNVKQN